MNDDRRVLISFKPSFANVDIVRAAVRGVCVDWFQLVCNAESIMDFCLIVSELLNNAVEHSNAPLIHVELLLSDHEAAFRLISDGIGFNTTRAVEMPSLQQGIELPEGGYGLALIQALADGMEYERREDISMVTLRKTFTVN